MYRKHLLGLLAAYNPTASEHLFKSQIIHFVQKYPTCFERSLEIGHVTASCWLINYDNSKALLTHHAKLNRWFQLGGHCDGESMVLRTALREAREESGMNHIVPVSKSIFDIDVHLIPENRKEKAHFHYDVRFLLQVQKDEPLVVSNESKALKWIDKNSASLPSDDPSVVRMFEKWLALKL